MADWEEIKRLAADFQRTQTTDTLQRLSEKNCIDIVKKLTDLGLIELIHTCDGKEFITPDNLLQEIEDETHFNGGRVHLHELASRLNVDYQHIENKAKELDRNEYNVILGQLIHSNYKETLKKQIYEIMIATGQLSIADFAKSLDLPAEFLLMIVKETMPQIIDDYVVSADERTYYTSDMMDRYKSIISGALSAVMKPTSIASILKKIDITERVFTPIVDSLTKEGRLDAIIENRQFIPSIYAREQNEWIDKFYATNSYIDYEVLARRDIKQPKVFLKKRFPEGVQLKNCFVSPTLMSQVESMVEDCIASNSLIDISTILPASIQPEDIEEMLNKFKQFSSSCVILQQTNVCSLGYIETFKQSLGNLMDEKAKQHLKEGKLVKHFLGSNVSKEGETQAQPSGVSNQESSNINKSQEQQDNNNKPVESQQQQQQQKQPEESTSKQKGDINIELTAEDLKREKRQRGKVSKEDLDSDDEQSGRKSKGGSSRKSGGGTQGREIKQKATKKKYLQGKNKQDSDDDEVIVAKTPRSSKGRAAKRAMSPSIAKSNTTKQVQEQSAAVISKEPLEFMSRDELVDSMRETSRDAGDFADEMFESIASMISDDLNKSYEILARKTLDKHLRSASSKHTSESDCNTQNELGDDIDLVE